MSRVLLALVAPIPFFAFASEDDLIDKLATTGMPGYEISRPGDAKVDFDDNMNEVKALGKSIWPKLLKRIGEIDNLKCDPEHEGQIQEGGKRAPEAMTARKKYLLKVSAIAAELKIKELAPFLFAYLEDNDNSFNSLLSVNLSRILELEDGYRFHRRWFDESVRKKFRDVVVKQFEDAAKK